MVLHGIDFRRLAAVLSCVAMIASRLWSFELREGDLLFTCSGDGNEITQVTSGVEGLPIDHVAVAHRIGSDCGPLFVVEAVPPVVRITPIDTFLTRLDDPRVVVGRLNVPFDGARSVRHCLLMVGKPYDDLYLPGDSALYCSELVQMNYVSPLGELIFEPVPMSFHDATGEITSYWIDFYGRRGMNVPEGAPGTNPGELSRRPQVTIVGILPVNSPN